MSDMVIATYRIEYGYTWHWMSLLRPESINNTKLKLAHLLIPVSSLQVLAGIYPIAQVREPYTAVMYLAERLPLPQLLQLQHPEAEKGMDAGKLKWSADDICYGKFIAENS